MSVNNYFKVTGMLFLFDDTSRMSTQAALQEAQILQGLRTTTGADGRTKMVPRISVWRKSTLPGFVPDFDGIFDETRESVTPVEEEVPETHAGFDRGDV